MEYLMLAPDIDTDPALEAAGWAATRVFELLLKVSALKDFRGRIPPQYQDSSWLAKRWNFSDTDIPGLRPADFIAHGMKRLLASGKVRQEEGCWVISGWEKFYKPAKTNAERQAEHRKRYAVTEVTGVTEPVTSNATQHNSTPLNTTPLHTTEEEEETPAAAVAPLMAPAPKAKRAKAKEAEHPRMRPLTDGLCAAFRQVTGKGYHFGGAKDAQAALRLLEMEASNEEIFRRWKIALGSEGFYLCRDVARFASMWNQYVSPPDAKKRTTDGYTRADEQDWANGGGFDELNRKAGAP